MTDEIARWLDEFAAAVRGVDYATGRRLYAPDVVGFGSVADRADGLDDLVARQWRRVWGVTRGFRFVDAGRVCRVVGDTAWVAADWWSQGGNPADGWYDRTGRVTIVLERRAGRWLAVHTHYSLAPKGRPPAPGPT